VIQDWCAETTEDDRMAGDRKARVLLGEEKPGRPALLPGAGRVTEVGFRTSDLTVGHG